jgi:hypothetical protein
MKIIDAIGRLAARLFGWIARGQQKAPTCFT